MANVTIGQCLIYALGAVWGLSVIWWGVEGAVMRHQRRIVRQRRIDPDWIASDETARRVFTQTQHPNVTLLRQGQARDAAIRRRVAGYQQGRDYR